MRIPGILILFLAAILVPLFADEDGWTVLQDGGASSNPAWQSRLLTSRIRQEAARIIPRKTGKLRYEREVKFNIPPPDGKGTFALREEFGGFRVSLPASFPEWGGDPVCVDRIVRLSLAARAGAGMEQMKRLPDCWLFAAVSFRSTFPESFHLRPYGAYPCAFALASRGIVPDLERLLDHPASPEDGAGRMAYEEWCSVLYELCRRYGCFHSGDGEKFFLALLASPGSDQAELFRTVFFPRILKHFAKGTLKREPMSMNEWFRRAAPGIILDAMLPCSPQLADTRFRNIVFPDRGNSVLKLAAGAAPLTADQQIALTHIAMDLASLQTVTPPGAGAKLGGFRNALAHLRESGPSPERLQTLKECLAAWGDSLVCCAAVENYLAAKEKELIPPGQRYTLLFAALRDGNSAKTTLQRQAERLLDDYEK